MKKLLTSAFYLPIFFVLSSLFVQLVSASACIGTTCYPTIQEAVDVASVSSIINVQNGTYTGPVTISKPVTIIGEDKNSTIVETGTTNVGFSLLTGADNVTIKNLKFTKNGDGINASNISNLFLQDLIIDNNSFSTSGIYLSDVSTASISGTIFSNNIIGLDLVSATSNITISTSTFSGNSSYHISNNTSNDVTAIDNNLWGTLDGNVLNTLLYDKNDSGVLGRIIFDNTKPSVDAGSDKIVNASFTQNATSSDTYGIASYLWTGPAQITFSNSTIEDPIVSASVDGTYTLTLMVTDTSGNTNSGNFKLIWDKTNPSGSWVTPSKNSTISGTTNLVVNTDDNLSGIDTTVYKYAPDGSSTFTTISGTNWDTTPLTLGKYTLRTIITDKAGNSYTADESVYVAAVITSFNHFTVGTDKIQVDWTTDRSTDGKVIYDIVSHSSTDGYAFNTGTLDYATTHHMIITGLSDNTYYYFRAVSAGTPIVVSNQGWNKTFTVAGADHNSSPTTSSAPPAIHQNSNQNTKTIIKELILLEEPPLTPTPIPTPNPTPAIEGTSTELPGFNWWLVIIPLPFALGFLLWLARKTQG